MCHSCVVIACRKPEDCRNNAYMQSVDLLQSQLLSMIVNVEQNSFSFCTWCVAANMISIIPLFEACLRQPLTAKPHTTIKTNNVKVPFPSIYRWIIKKR